MPFQSVTSNRDVRGIVFTKIAPPLPHRGDFVQCGAGEVDGCASTPARAMVAITNITVTISCNLINPLDAPFKQYVDPAENIGFGGSL